MKQSSRLIIALTSFLVLVTVISVGYIIMSNKLTYQKQKSVGISNSTANFSKMVVALGYIQPKGKVIKLFAYSNLVNPRVSQVLVKEGEKVKANQVMAILDTMNNAQAALNQAQKSFQVAQASLAQVKSGDSKRGDIIAQEAQIANLEVQFNGEVATQKFKISGLRDELNGQINAEEAIVNRWQAQWNNAKVECKRYETLFQQGAVTPSMRDSKCLEAKTAQEQLIQEKANKKRIVETLSKQINEAKVSLNQTLLSFPKQIKQATANLQKLKEVRPQDVQVAQAESEREKAAVLQAETELDLTYVRAPVDGQVLKINTFPGERISSEGILDLAQIEQMYVVAEVYETDLKKVHLGQLSIISSSALQEKFKGRVEQISFQIKKRTVLTNDPTLEVDARVADIKIILEPEYAQRAAQFINLQVEVKIETST